MAYTNLSEMFWEKNISTKGNINNDLHWELFIFSTQIKKTFSFLLISSLPFYRIRMNILPNLFLQMMRVFWFSYYSETFSSVHRFNRNETHEYSGSTIRFIWGLSGLVTYILDFYWRVRGSFPPGFIFKK